MKRSELKVGETYAVLAPSQKSGYASATKVTVLDLEPKWREAYRSFNYSRQPEPRVTVTNAEGQKVKAIDSAELAGQYDRGAAGRSVLVVEERPQPWNKQTPVDWIRTVAPLSQVRMTWAEYEKQRRAFERAQQARWDEQERVRKEAEDRKAAAAALRDALNTKLEDSPFNARVLDGEVVLAGPYDELVKLVSVR